MITAAIVVIAVGTVAGFVYILSGSRESSHVRDFIPFEVVDDEEAADCDASPR